jgi:hypothetical protein
MTTEFGGTCVPPAFYPYYIVRTLKSTFSVFRYYSSDLSESVAWICHGLFHGIDGGIGQGNVAGRSQALGALISHVMALSANADQVLPSRVTKIASRARDRAPLIAMVSEACSRFSWSRAPGDKEWVLANDCRL